jgi:hypothetical protein
MDMVIIERWRGGFIWEEVEEVNAGMAATREARSKP